MRALALRQAFGESISKPMYSGVPAICFQVLSVTPQEVALTGMFLYRDAPF